MGRNPNPARTNRTEPTFCQESNSNPNLRTEHEPKIKVLRIRTEPNPYHQRTGTEHEPTILGSSPSLIVTGNVDNFVSLMAAALKSRLELHGWRGPRGFSGNPAGIKKQMLRDSREKRRGRNEDAFSCNAAYRCVDLQWQKVRICQQLFFESHSHGHVK